MSLILDLPQALESELAAEAARTGMSLQEYVVQIIAVARKPIPEIRTGADLVAFWDSESFFGSRPDITDPYEFCRSLRAEAEHRVRD